MRSGSVESIKYHSTRGLSGFLEALTNQTLASGVSLRKTFIGTRPPFPWGSAMPKVLSSKPAYAGRMKPFPLFRGWHRTHQGYPESMQNWRTHFRNQPIPSPWCFIFEEARHSPFPPWARTLSWNCVPTGRIRVFKEDGYRCIMKVLKRVSRPAGPSPTSVATWHSNGLKSRPCWRRSTRYPEA